MYSRFLSQSHRHCCPLPEIISSLVAIWVGPLGSIPPTPEGTPGGADGLGGEAPHITDGRTPRRGRRRRGGAGLVPVPQQVCGGDGLGGGRLGERQLPPTANRWPVPWTCASAVIPGPVRSGHPPATPSSGFAPHPPPCPVRWPRRPAGAAHAAPPCRGRALAGRPVETRIRFYLSMTPIFKKLCSRKKLPHTLQKNNCWRQIGRSAGARRGSSASGSGSGSSMSDGESGSGSDGSAPGGGGGERQTQPRGLGELCLPKSEVFVGLCGDFLQEWSGGSSVFSKCDGKSQIVYPPKIKYPHPPNDAEGVPSRLDRIGFRFRLEADLVRFILRLLRDNEPRGPQSGRGATFGRHSQRVGTRATFSPNLQPWCPLPTNVRHASWGIYQPHVIRTFFHLKLRSLFHHQCPPSPPLCRGSSSGSRSGSTSSERAVSPPPPRPATVGTHGCLLSLFIIPSDPDFNARIR